MRKMYIVIFRWMGAGLRDCWLFTIIVCETRPYILMDSETGSATSVIIS
jgi:hypothetical protein